MNKADQAPSFSPVTRRTFLRNGAILTAGVAALSLPARARVNKNSKLRIFQVGVGGIGGLQRGGLKGHPQVEWAGFCDVDRRELENIKKEQPNAWTTSDYREAFANKVGDFDAVIVDVPDFHHAPVMLTAMKHNKHMYGQKPLVHQLAELKMIRDGLKARPSLITHTPKPSGIGHSAHNQSTLTYAGGGRFAREKFVVHYNDDALRPSFAALNLPPVKPGANHTMVVCEEGTLLLQADGSPQIFRKGKEVEDESLPTVAPRNHWKDWADNCLGDHKPLWTPFDIGSRITEPALLAVKATRYPGVELRWDAANYRFTNHEKANQEILSRQYRAGFAPPAVA